MSNRTPCRVAVVGGVRTPFVKAGTAFRQYSALDLGVHAVKGLIDHLAIEPETVEELVHGTVIPNPFVSNIAREIVFELGLPSSIHAYSLSNNCITGIHTVTAVANSIALGNIEVGIAGGAESMSNPPVSFGKEMSRIVLDAWSAKTAGRRISTLLKVRPRHFKPVAPAVAERSTGLSMGEHTELTAKEWKIPRQEQDEIAYHSHMNAHRANGAGLLQREIHPLDGIDRDPIIRPDTSLERLAKLPPVFDRSPAGTLTAGNSSPLTDGASAVLLMSEERVEREGREPLAFVRAVEYAAIDPDDGLLMGPAVAVPRVLKKAGLTLADMGIIEMHEAFGAQVAANLQAWKQGWKEPAIGEVNREILNPLGSSIAVGHPFAATGGRIVTTLANQMKRNGTKYGLISICAAGAMAAAMILERA